MCTYAYLASYINRCREGESSALFGPAEQIVMFALTSGTTAPAKYIPVTKRSLEAYRRGWEIWGVKAISDHPDSYLRKILQVTSPAQEYRSSGGISCGAISGMLARNQRRIVRRFYATPYEVAEINDATARYYSIMRLAVTQDVAFITTANPSTMLALARVAREQAEQLIRDIHDGTLSAALNIDKAIRGQLQGHLRARPDRAAQLQELLSKHGQLLPRHYWNLSFLAHWTGGALKTYLPRLSEYYGAAPIRDIGLLASEGRMSIPRADNTPAGVLDLSSNFYEFVPQQEIENLDQPQSRVTLGGKFTTLQSCQLEKGQNYYIFLTNFAGLTRYHMGDLVRVTGHNERTPVIEFLSKGAHGSNITGEKLTEEQVVDAVHVVSDELALHIENFIVMPVWDEVPHYRLYFFSPQSQPRKDLVRMSQMIDRRLATHNIEYESKRNSGRLGEIDMRQVPAQYLDERDEELLRNNMGRREQFKHRFLYNTPLE